MEAEGFSRTIKDDDGTEYRLPTAEYNLIGSFRRKEVLDKAKSAADGTGKKYFILVTESKGRTWAKLKRV